MENLTYKTTLHYRGQEFIICHSDTYNKYMAFKAKDIKDGKLQREYNGIQAFANDTIDSTIAAVEMSVDIDILVKSGMSVKDAFKKVIEEECKWLKGQNK